MMLDYSLSVCGNMRRRKPRRRRLSWSKKPHGNALKRLHQRKQQVELQCSSLDPCPVNRQPCSESNHSCGKQMSFSLLVSKFGQVFPDVWISRIVRCSWNVVQDWVVYTRYIKVGKLTKDLRSQMGLGTVASFSWSWVLASFGMLRSAVDCCIIYLPCLKLVTICIICWSCNLLMGIWFRRRNWR